MYIIYSSNPWESNHRDGSMGHKNIFHDHKCLLGTKIKSEHSKFLNLVDAINSKYRKFCESYNLSHLVHDDDAILLLLSIVL